MIMNPVNLSLTFTVDPDGIALSQTPGGAGDFTLNGVLVSGGVATLDAAQKVSFTSGSDESGDTYTVTGTDNDGRALIETLSGPNATTVKTTEYFKTVTQISTDGAATGAITIGSGDEGVTQTIPTDILSNPFSLSMGVTLTSGASLTYEAQHTFHDIQDFTVNPVWFPNDGLTAKTANDDGNIAFPVTGLRLSISSFVSGTASMIAIQAI